MSSAGCRFCRDNGLLSDRAIVETDRFYVLMSMDPELPQAAMIVPHRHSTDPFSMSEAEWADLPSALNATRSLLEQRFAPEGFTLGWNVGTVAGQTVLHTHLHVIARFSDEPMTGKGIRHAFKNRPVI